MTEAQFKIKLDTKWSKESSVQFYPIKDAHPIDEYNFF